VTAVFIGTSLVERGLLLDCVKAMAEAAMVGALADWFAVVALFRRPLGLPIPHTAVIPRNKDRIGVNLAAFVRDRFLDPPSLVALLRVTTLPCGWPSGWAMQATLVCWASRRRGCSVPPWIPCRMRRWSGSSARQRAPSSGGWICRAPWPRCWGRSRTTGATRRCSMMRWAG
jgi:hypothetical protein